MAVSGWVIFGAGVIFWIFSLFVFYWIFKIFKKQMDKFGLWLKYRWGKKPFDPTIEVFCRQAIAKDMNESSLRMALLIHGTKKKRQEEILYIFRCLEKQKGGEESG